MGFGDLFWLFFVMSAVQPAIKQPTKPPDVSR